MQSKRVLVDTSAWIDFLKGKEPAVKHLGSLMETERVVICGVIKQEVLQGSRQAKALAKLESEMSLWEYEAEQPEDFVGAARIFARLRWDGITVPPSDCLVAALAIRWDLEVYATDKHFRKIPDLKLYTP